MLFNRLRVMSAFTTVIGAHPFVAATMDIPVPPPSQGRTNPNNFYTLPKTMGFPRGAPPPWNPPLKGNFPLKGGVSPGGRSLPGKTHHFG